MFDGGATAILYENSMENTVFQWAKCWQILITSGAIGLKKTHPDFAPIKNRALRPQ